MKTIILMTVFAFLPFQSFAQTSPVPTLFFSYSWLYDSMCANTPERKIEDSWVAEARTKVPEFTATWNQFGPTLFGKVFEIFGFGFSRKEMTATLSVCPVPSYSDPLVLNVTRYLKSYMGEKPVAPPEAFADLVFHELLHTWVVEHTDWPTAMIQKYQQEQQVTRNHLHLMAVQKLVYQKLNNEDMLKRIEEQYNRNPGYKRAWEIVALEGTEAFTAEFVK